MTTLTDLVSVLADLERERNETLERMAARLDALEARPEVYSVADFADVCGCHADTVRKAIDEDLIRSIQIGDRTTLIPSTELAGEWASDRRRRLLRPVQRGAA